MVLVHDEVLKKWFVAEKIPSDTSRYKVYIDEGLNHSNQTEQDKIRLKAFKLCQHSENYQKTLEAVQHMNMDDKKEVKIQYGNKKSTGIHIGTVFSPPAPPGFDVFIRVKEKKTEAF